MKKLLLDINVVLDILLDRKPHAAVSGVIWAKIEKGEVKGFLPAHGVTTIHYLIERDRGAQVLRVVAERLRHGRREPGGSTQVVAGVASVQRLRLQV